MTKTFLRSWKPAVVLLSIILLAGGLGSQSSQAPVDGTASSGYTIKWIRSFGNFFGLTPDMIAAGYDENDECVGAVETGDGGLVLAGTVQLFPPGGSHTQDLIVMEVRPSGEVDWELAYECAPGEDISYSSTGIARCSNGDYLITGNHHGGSQAIVPGSHPVLMRISPSGGLRWIKVFGVGSPGQANFEGSGIPVPTADGGFLMSGFSSAVPPWIMKLDSAGNVMWCKSYSLGLGDPHPTSDGGFVVTGNADRNGLIVKCDSSGVIQWHRAFAQDPGWGCDDLETFIDAMTPTPDGGFLLFGDTTACNCCRANQANYWMCKLDASGRIVWKKGAPGVHDVFPTRDGGFVLDDQYSLIKYNASGSFLWSRTVTGTTMRYAFEARDGGFAVAGHVYPLNADNALMTVLRLDSAGKIGACDRITSNLVSPGGTGIHSVSAASISVRARPVWMKSLPRTNVNRSCEVRTLCTSLSLRHIPARIPTSGAQRP